MTLALDFAPARAAVIGGGPAGLMAAETLLDAGVGVDLYDAMPSVARKFLLAGKGGLNLTHAEAFDPFVGRYREAAEWLRPLLAEFGADQLRVWCHGLGIQTLVGSSQRVFPVDFKSAPLVRAWLHRLRGMGLVTHMRHRWLGWTPEGECLFQGPQGSAVVAHPSVVVLALGGGSWARLGSDGHWQGALLERGVEVAPLEPSNCGFELNWSERLRSEHAGAPLKTVALNWRTPQGPWRRQTGEMVVSEHGLEGSLIYAASADLRRLLEQDRSQALATLDLLPQVERGELTKTLQTRGSRSLSSCLRSKYKLSAVKVALVYECLSKATLAQPEALAAGLKALPLNLLRPRPLDEAISSAGGVKQASVTPDLMLKSLPGVFCAGEMLDWEAPTGGYLLTACFATGRRAGQGALRWLHSRPL